MAMRYLRALVCGAVTREMVRGTEALMPVCTEHGCPEIIPASGYCPTHKRQRNIARGSRQQRGYDTDHDRLRRAWLPRVATGKVACPKCGELIERGQRWDLGHTDDRIAWTGPEHVACNRSDAGRKAHRRAV